MEVISIREARKRLSDLVSAAERGESVLISRRGREVARIVPVLDNSTRGLPDLADFRASLKVGGASLASEVLALRDDERS